jgi:hypothetical protein
MNNEDLNKKRKYLLWGIPLCIIMAVFQLMRGLNGNNRSWLYVFEWPFFAVFIYYMYWKMGQPLPKYEDDEEKK